MHLIDRDYLLEHASEYFGDYWDQEIMEMPVINAIPMAWISAYTRGPLSNKDYWSIIRMVTKWEEENEI